MLSRYSELNFSKSLQKLFFSFYNNNLIQLSAENAQNGFYIDDSKKGISHTLIRNYLLNVRKKNKIQVNNQYVLKQTQLQSQYDNIFSSSNKYIQNDLITADQVLLQHSEINSASLVLVEDGTIKFLTNKESIDELQKYFYICHLNNYKIYFVKSQKKKVALIGKVLNVQGIDILNELKYQDSIVLKDFVPYKQIILNRLLLLVSGLFGLSIISDLATTDRKKNLLNPLIRNEEQQKYIFQIQQQDKK